MVNRRDIAENEEEGIRVVAGLGNRVDHDEGNEEKNADEEKVEVVEEDAEEDVDGIPLYLPPNKQYNVCFTHLGGGDALLSSPPALGLDDDKYNKEIEMEMKIYFLVIIISSSSNNNTAAAASTL